MILNASQPLFDGVAKKAKISSLVQQVMILVAISMIF